VPLPLFSSVAVGEYRPPCSPGATRQDPATGPTRRARNAAVRLIKAILSVRPPAAALCSPGSSSVGQFFCEHLDLLPRPCGCLFGAPGLVAPPGVAPAHSPSGEQHHDPCDQSLRHHPIVPSRLSRALSTGA